MNRHRLQKCDGQRPVCTQCVKANRDVECQYHDKKQVSRTELFRAKVAKLEARLREREKFEEGRRAREAEIEQQREAERLEREREEEDVKYKHKNPGPSVYGKRNVVCRDRLDPHQQAI